MGPMTHAPWLGSCVFDGARAFEGVINGTSTALGGGQLPQVFAVGRIVQGQVREGEPDMIARKAISRAD